MLVFFYLKYEDVDVNIIDYCYGVVVQWLWQYYQLYGVWVGVW